MKTTSVIFAALATMADARLDEELQRMWENYKITHKKNYEKDEEVVRFENYKKSMEAADELSKDNPHATISQNIFSDMSEEEFRLKFRSGYTPETELFQEHEKFPFSYKEVAALRSDLGFDWSNTDPPAVTPVKNQGLCGGCWAFSATGAIEGQWAIKGHGLVSLSEEELIACESPDGCKGGNYITAFQNLLNNRKGNIVTELSYPYADARSSSKTGEASCKSVTGLPIGAHITTYKSYTVNETELYSLVKTHGPISVAVDSTCWKSYNGGILTKCVSTVTDHAVLVVGHGYDSTADLEFWIVKNSWGSAWGENGYIRFQFGKNLCLITNRAVAFPIVTEFEAPALVPSDDGLAPGIVTPPPLNPHRPIPDTPPSTDVVCIAGKDCSCPDVCYFCFCFFYE